ncbi:MAG: LysR substrate-binding domain-containing protein [Motiliproteus sp.]
MTPDELNRIDLNLLVAFNALMDERSVSRAAERLHVTQPAMSKTLQRLRDLFNEPLFLRTPKGLEPTPRSLELQAPVAEVLEQLITVITPAEFDPASLTRTFNLAIADPMAAFLVPGLVGRLEQEAPSVSLKLRGYIGDSIDALSKGTLDFVVGLVTENAPAGVHARTLFQDKGCCLMRPGHPLAQQERLSIEELVAYDHIKPWFKGINDKGPMDIQLKSMGFSRHIRIEASHFLTIIRTLQNSDAVAIGFDNWVSLFPGGELVRVELPESLDSSVVIHLLWDERSHNDPACRWFRQLMVDVAGSEM